MDELWVCQLGLVPYLEALALQERLCSARQSGQIPDTMLLLEHPAVVTRGRRAADGDLPLPESWYRNQGVDIVDVNRGGKLTYHGPGQLVGYPIVAVEDVVAYVRRLEQGLIGALFEQGVLARARVLDGSDYTGVWVEDRKIASIGVHVSKGVTTHGFALNVVNDMTPWSWFTACGLPSVPMTSVAAELGRAPDGVRSALGPGSGSGELSEASGAADCAPASSDLMDCMRKRAGFFVADTLGRRQRLVTPARLARALGGEAVLGLGSSSESAPAPVR